MEKQKEEVMFKKIALWFIKLLRAAGLKKPEKKPYFHENPVHFIVDKKPIRIISVAEAIKRGVDVDKDIRENDGIRPVYYYIENGNMIPNFHHDLISLPSIGYPPEYYRELFKNEQDETSDT